MLRLVPLMALFSTPIAHADLIIDIQDATFSAGGTGFVDVWISGEDADDLLGKFSAKFSITQKSGTGTLEFRNNFSSADPSAADRQNNSELSNINYVFPTPIQSAAFASAQLGNAQTLLQSHSATENVLLGSSPKLLARLELVHVLPAGTSGGGEYEIALVNDQFTKLNRFDDPSSDASRDIAAQSFTNVGTITAVPEPTCLWLAGVVGAMMGVRRRVWRR